MICFEVSRNGEHLCRAGISAEGIVHVTVTYADVKRSGRSRAREIDLRVGALETATSEHLSWVTQDLVAGDRVEVKVVESEEESPPAAVEPPRTHEAQMKDDLRRLRQRRRSLLKELESMLRDEAFWTAELEAIKRWKRRKLR